MLTHPTHDRLLALGLTGIAKALEEQRRSTAFDDLTFEERLGILVDREAAEGDGKKLASRLKFAALRQDASVEDLDLRTPRGLDRSVMAHLADGGWIARHENLLITGPTGLGKSWIACALGHKACRDGRPVLYQRAPRMFEALALARGDGRHERILKTIARMDVLTIYDWGLAILTAPERRDLLEILEDRHGRASTIVTSQLPVEHWHEAIGDPTLADAILDRVRAFLRTNGSHALTPQRPQAKTHRRKHAKTRRCGTRKGPASQFGDSRRLPAPGNVNDAIV